MRAKKEAAIFIAGIAALAISFLIDKQALSLSYKIQSLALDYFFTAIAQFGHIFVVLIVTSSLFLWEEGKREWIPVLWASFLVTGVLSFVLKEIFMRLRPTDVLVLGGLFMYSFPSLHTAGAFTALPVLSREFPRLKFFWIAFAFLVAFSRIYLQAHYLSDVVGGILLGYGVGFLFVYLEERYRIFKRIRKKGQNDR